MKTVRRIIILIIAAALGTVFYQRYHAVSNIAEGTQSSAASSYRSQNTSPIGNVGGIGPVSNQPRLKFNPQRPPRHRR